MVLRILGQHLRRSLRSSSPNDDLLPTKALNSPLPPWRSNYVSKRYARLIVSAFISILLVIGFFRFESQSAIPFDITPITQTHPDLPPLYEQYHQQERTLPQHNTSLPFPEGEHAKFIYFNNYISGLGFGNALQELIMHGHLAYLSKRAMVFHNYTWDRGGGDYSKFKDNIIPSVVPYSTMLGGPLIGGSFGENSNIPRAVSAEYYDRVCPQNDRTVLRVEEVTQGLNDPSGAELLQCWVDKLSSLDDRCVEIDRSSTNMFDMWFFGSHRALDVWPSLLKSPVLKLWDWSPLILSAFEFNKGIFQRVRDSSAFPFTFKIPFFPKILPTSSPTSRFPELKEVLALHVRRGDFEEHCNHLAKWSSSYMGWNTFDEFPDRFEVPAGGGWGENTPENTDIYIKHCYPSIPQIVRKVTALREEQKNMGTPIRRVYTMTNAPRDWLQELKIALEESAPGELEMVASSRDLALSWEQKYVAQALDIYIGQRAQVFVGNGFSTLTSNVALLRLTNGLNPANTHFW